MDDVLIERILDDTYAQMRKPEMTLTKIRRIYQKTIMDNNITTVSIVKRRRMWEAHILN